MRQSLLGNFLKKYAMSQFMPAETPEEGAVNGAVQESALNSQGGAFALPVEDGMAKGLEKSSWNFGDIGKQIANSAVPGIFNGQGNFSPMNAFEQNTYGPYFGQNGIFNLTQNGPWRRN